MLEKSRWNMKTKSLDMGRLAHRGGSNLKHLLFKVSVSAFIYHQWNKRNHRIFQHNHRLGLLSQNIKAYVSLWRHVRKSDENRVLCLDWNISCRVIEAS
ncbi:hypothetical protein RHSIM_Rhsim07G0248000 [Rhododendron simsii]|uniref:Uncharacterized protein n=1 Tax=Rhododendron simsii TaxID=118357 RepID=A0A834GMT7_RHOSS|nr:hypothetical protein RHSIM_Rhsim07G0248000 [Rhododendron simsii]